MNKIEAGLALPVFHDRIPARAQGGDFREQLLAPAADGLPPGSNGREMKAEQLRADLRERRSSVERASADTELFGFAGTAMQQLSYLAKGQSDRSQSGGTPATHAIRQAPVPVADDASCGPGIASMADVAEGRPDWSVAASTEIPASSDEGVEVAGIAAVLRDGLPEQMRRKIRFLQASQGVDAVVRDYETEAIDRLVQQVVAHCRDAGIPLRRIVLNGAEVWSVRE